MYWSEQLRDETIEGTMTPTYEDECGEPAIHRCSWDLGNTWLYVCTKHMKEIESKN